MAISASAAGRNRIICLLGYFRTGRQVDQPLPLFGERSGDREERPDVGLVGHVGEPVGAEQDQLAGKQRAPMDVRLDPLGRADRPHDHVAHRVAARIRLGQQPTVDLLLDQGVVLRDPGQPAGVKAIAPAVADVPDDPFVADDQQQLGRAPHPLAAGGFGRVGQDVAVGGMEDVVRQLLRIVDRAGRARRNRASGRVGEDRRGHLAEGRTAHPVGDGERALLGHEQEDVLVVVAVSPDVGQPE
jgi:hypothetical protein